MKDRSELPPIYWLDEITDPLASSPIGAKASNLARLRRAGLPVPNGFVIPPSACDSELLDTSTINAVRAALATWNQWPLAIRSSANVEDQEHASFAGQGKTVLGARNPEEVLEAVQRVLSESGALRRGSYPAGNGSVHDLQIAVIVQAMVPAEIAGILFTANPVTGDANQWIVNVVPGLGDQLAGGRINPDEMVFDAKTGAEIDRRRGEIPAAQSQDKDSQYDLDAVPWSELHELGRRIAELFDHPQDIEWARAEGRFQILQSRPITGLSWAEFQRSILRREQSRLQKLPRPHPRAYAATGMAELLPHPTTLSWELASRCLSGTAGYGLAQSRLGFRPAPDTILERIAGRVYVDLHREIGMFFHHAPLRCDLEYLRRNPARIHLPRYRFDWSALLGWRILGLPGLIVRLPVTLRNLHRQAAQYPRQLHQELIPDLQNRLAESRPEALHPLSPTALVEVFLERRHRFLSEYAPNWFVGTILAALAHRRLEDLLIDLAGANGAELARDLISGLEPNPQLEMYAARESLATGRLSLAQFLAAFGHRGPQEWELAAPRYHEISNELPRPDSPGSPPASLNANSSTGQRGKARRRSAEAKLDSLLCTRGNSRHHAVLAAWHRARALFPLREVCRDQFARELDLLRRPLAELDRKLGADGGVFHLFSHELAAAARKDPQSKSLIESRRHNWIRCQSIELPDLIFDLDQAPATTPATSQTARHITGVGVASGQAEGVVQIASSPTALSSRRPRTEPTILVVPTLDPAWFPHLDNVAGIIAHCGATLSHGAILARELGIPTITGIPNAHTILPAGSRLRINGATGEIHILSGHEHNH